MIQFRSMSDPRPCRWSIDSGDRNDRECNDIVRPRLRTVPGRTPRRMQIDFHALEVEMSDLNAAHGAAATGRNVNDSKISFENDNRTDKTFPSEDDGRLLPSQAVATDETIRNIMDEDTPKAFNLYRNKKLLSHGMMDVALFSANANQLRYVLESSNGSAVYVICVVLLLISIFLQILVGVALLLSARYNVTNCDQRKMAFKLGNYVIVGIFLITVVNIFITSFGGPTVTPPTILTDSTTELPDLIRSTF